jgi:hypothetical protein
MAQAYNFTIDAGSRCMIVFAVTVDWLTDLTGYTASSLVRRSQSDVDTLLDLTPFLAVSVANDTVTLDLPADTSDAITWEAGYYDVYLSDGNPDHDVRIVQGQIAVDR